MQVDIDRLRSMCNGGKEYEITTKGIWIEEGAAGRLYRMLIQEELGEFIAPVIVWDDNTREASEEAMCDIEDICLEAVCMKSEDLCADNYGVAILTENIPEETDLIIAVGGGTIHDLCRYVADEINVPFISVPTAASMDGFASNVAAMTVDGMKKTVVCHAPEYVFADTKLIARAPSRLNAAGVADVLGKYTALADWKIASIVTGEYYCEEIADMEYEAIRRVTDAVADIRKGEEDAFEKLMYALLLSGIAMQLFGNSRPASCSEHHMAHLWEMEVVSPHTDAWYGEKVSVGLLLIRKQYETIGESIHAGACKVVAYPGMETRLLAETFGKKGLYKAMLAENTPDPMADINPEVLLEALPEIAGIVDAIPDRKSVV